MAYLDPELTMFGVKEAKVTGKFLKNYIHQFVKKFDKLIIKSSPFLSTMMTAAHIATALKK